MGFFVTKAAAEERPVTTPPPPYIAVIFVARLRDVDLTDYFEAADELMARARSIPGFIGEDALRHDDRRVISISYWRDDRAVDRWRRDLEHVIIKRRGRAAWYAYYELKIARVEKASSFLAEREMSERQSGLSC
jgi:heme-degrading monooxygenase HmoA